MCRVSTAARWTQMFQNVHVSDLLVLEPGGGREATKPLQSTTEAAHTAIATTMRTTITSNAAKTTDVTERNDRTAGTTLRPSAD